MTDYTDPGEQERTRKKVRKAIKETLEIGDDLFGQALREAGRAAAADGSTRMGLPEPTDLIAALKAPCVTGVQNKERELELHDDRKKEAIVWLRKQLAKLYQQRTSLHPSYGAFVTADDARRIYDASRFPKEYSQSHTFFGSIFRGNDWKPTGQRVPSLHPANNARSIMCWQYVGKDVD
jgi:hypothetical protein